MKQIRKQLILVSLLSFAVAANAQQLDLDNLLNFKGKYFRYGGGVFLNTIFTNSSDEQIMRYRN